MKKTILFLLLAFFTSALMTAADNKQRAATLADNLEKELALTADQKTKVYDLLLAKFDALDKYNKASLTEQEKQAIMLEKRKFVTELRAILTDDQYTKWHGLRNEQSKQMKKGEKVQTPVIDPQLEFLVNQ
jgi:hypothetical protein